MRPTDPLALSAQQWRPRTYAPRPQRVADRIHMHGTRIEPLHPQRICGLQRLSNAVVIGLFAVIAVLSAVHGWRW
jgi:hypothetical protein